MKEIDTLDNVRRQYLHLESEENGIIIQKLEQYNQLKKIVNSYKGQGKVTLLTLIGTLQNVEDSGLDA